MEEGWGEVVWVHCTGNTMENILGSPRVEVSEIVPEVPEVWVTVSHRCHRATCVNEAEHFPIARVEVRGQLSGAGSLLPPEAVPEVEFKCSRWNSGGPA